MRKMQKANLLSSIRASGALIILTCLFMASFLFARAALAQTGGPQFGLDTGFTTVAIQSDRDVKELIASIINIALGFLGIIAVVIIVYAGYMWATAGGNADQVERAKLILRNAIIGLVVIFSAWAIATFVISRLSRATDAGGGSVYTTPVLPPGSGRRPGDFYVQQFNTKHSGTLSSDGVFVCSSIQAQFNHWLQEQSFSVAKNGDNLTIIKDGESSPIANLAVSLHNNLISFELDDGGTRLEWDKNSSYQVRLDKEIQDRANKKLGACDTCSGEENDYYYWNFNVGQDDDNVKPTVSDTYPKNNDKNIPRAGYLFSINFSEDIDAGVITPEGELNTDNIKLEERQSSGSYKTVPGSQIDVTHIGDGVHFAVNSGHKADFDDVSGALEPYTQYRIIIQGIKDLCGNAMDGVATIIFETGADLPGVASVYPTSNFVCPNNDSVFAMFRTTMYNVRTQECGVEPNGNSGFVLGGALQDKTNGGSIPPRPFPEDNFIPGFHNNPNDFCKEYRFDLTKGDLNESAKYEASILYAVPGGLIIDPANHRNTSWGFGVSTSEQCLNPPFIKQLSPANGPWGRCFTVMGENFGGEIDAKSNIVAKADVPSAPNSSGVFPNQSQYDYWTGGWVADEDNFSLLADICRSGAGAATSAEGNTIVGLGSGDSTLQITGTNIKIEAKSSGTIVPGSSSTDAQVTFSSVTVSGDDGRMAIVKKGGAEVARAVELVITGDILSLDNELVQNYKVSSGAIELKNAEQTEFTINKGVIEITKPANLGAGNISIKGRDVQITGSNAVVGADSNVVVTNPVITISGDSGSLASVKKGSQETKGAKLEITGKEIKIPGDAVASVENKKNVILKPPPAVSPATDPPTLQPYSLDVNISEGNVKVLKKEPNLADSAYTIEGDYISIESPGAGDINLGANPNVIINPIIKVFDDNPQDSVDTAVIKKDGADKFRGKELEITATQIHINSGLIQEISGSSITLRNSKKLDLQSISEGRVETNLSSSGGICPEGANEWRTNSIVASMNNLDAMSRQGSGFSNRLLQNLPSSLPGTDGEKLAMQVYVEVSTPQWYKDLNLGDTVKSNALIYTAYRNDPAYVGPCLFSLDPSQGAYDTEVTVKGKRFNSSWNGTGAFRSAFVDGISALKNWSAPTLPRADSEITIKIPQGAREGQTWVETKYGESNRILFNVANGVGDSCNATTGAAVCTPIQSCAEGLACRLPGEPEACTCQSPLSSDIGIFGITNSSPKNTCTDAFTNAVVHFETNKDYNSATAQRSIKIETCSSQSCISGITDVTSSFTSSLAPKLVDMRPASGNMTPNTWYRVTIQGGSAGLMSIDSEEMKSSYTWTFKTGASAGTATSVYVWPKSATIVSNSSQILSAHAQGTTASCGAQDLVITEDIAWDKPSLTGDDPESACFNASSPKEKLLSFANIAEVSYKQKQTASVAAFPAGDTDYRRALACAKYQTKTGSSPITLVPRCTSNADCTISDAGGSAICSSACNTSTGICAPKITDFNPQEGEISTWITINGCYLGYGWGEVKINGVNAEKPDVAMCGNTWSSRQIIAEVAPGTTSGGLEVITEDARKVSVSGPYAVSGTIHPAICLVAPNQGSTGNVISIKGHNFGSYEEFSSRANQGDSSSSYRIIFADTGTPVKEKSTDVVVVQSSNSKCPENGWSENNVCVKVVSGVRRGLGTIRVRSNDAESAKYNFRIVGSALGAGAMTITNVSPDASQEACLNQVVQVDMQGTLDISSLRVLAGEKLTSAQMASSNFYVLRKSDNHRLSGEITVSYRGNKTTLMLLPDVGELIVGSDYDIVVKGGDSGLQSLSGGLLDINGSKCASKTQDACSNPFSTVTDGGLDRCLASHIEIEPADSVYTCARENCDANDDGVIGIGEDDDASLAGRQQIYTAMPKNKGGDTINLNSSLGWSSQNAQILSQSNPVSANLSSTQKLFTINPQDGTTKISVNSASNIHGETQAQVFLCENAWPSSMSQDGKPFYDKLGDNTFTSKYFKTNFSTFYCKDRGEAGFEDDLPGLSMSCAGGTDNGKICSINSDCASNSCQLKFAEFGKDSAREVGGLLKEIFLTQPWSRECKEGDQDKIGSVCSENSNCGEAGKCVGEVDAIGIRVVGLNQCTQGDASKIGNSCLANSECGNQGKCEFNQENYSIQSWYNNQEFTKGSPQPITVDGFDGLQEGRTVYVSAPNDLDDDGIDEDDIFNNIYLMSFNDKAHEDTVNILNQMIKNWKFIVNIPFASSRENLRADLKRLEDARYLANQLQKRAAPALNSGSFQKGVSLSVWPSWQQSLSQDFGISLPIDPKNPNNVECSSKTGIDQDTCWDKNQAPWQFICDAGSDSNFYAYAFDESSGTGAFYMELEYKPIGAWNNEPDSLSHYDNSQYQCLNLKISAP